MFWEERIGCAKSRDEGGLGELEDILCEGGKWRETDRQTDRGRGTEQ